MRPIFTSTGHGDSGMTQKNLTSSVYTFEDLIGGGYLYVDKTEQLWQLMEPGKGIYFLSRPRRFGKSLTISTLKAAFQGKQKLFEGLALATKPSTGSRAPSSIWTWPTAPPRRRSGSTPTWSSP